MEMLNYLHVVYAEETVCFENFEIPDGYIIEMYQRGDNADDFTGEGTCQPRWFIDLMYEVSGLPPLWEGDDE